MLEWWRLDSSLSFAAFAIMIYLQVYKQSDVNDDLWLGATTSICPSMLQNLSHHYRCLPRAGFRSIGRVVQYQGSTSEHDLTVKISIATMHTPSSSVQPDSMRFQRWWPMSKQIVPRLFMYAVILLLWVHIHTLRLLQLKNLPEASWLSDAAPNC